MVRRWRTNFIEGPGEVHDKQCSGRSKNAITDDEILAVETIISEDHRLTIDIILQLMPPEINISQTLVHTIIEKSAAFS